jgi:DNA polymerase III gamma/tau subunit
VFALVETLMDEGYDLVEFYHGLVDVLRGLIRVRLTNGAWADVREDLRDAFRQRAEAFAPGDLVRMLALASELEANGSIRKTGDPRLLVEMLLLRFSYLDRTVELEELLRAVGGAPPRGGEGREREERAPARGTDPSRGETRRPGSGAPASRSAAAGSGSAASPAATAAAATVSPAAASHRVPRAGERLRPTPQPRGRA